MKIAGMHVDPGTMLAAAAVDRLSMLVWAKTKDSTKGKNRPKSILEEMTKPARAETNEVRGYQSAEEFEAARQRILQGGG